LQRTSMLQRVLSRHKDNFGYGSGPIECIERPANDWPSGERDERLVAGAESGSKTAGHDNRGRLRHHVYILLRRAIGFPVCS